MSLVSGLVIYLIIWWLVLFMVLPVGIRRVQDPQPGHDPGAPEKAHMALRMVVTTAISALLWVLVYVIITFDVVSLDDI